MSSVLSLILFLLAGLVLAWVGVVLLTMRMLTRPPRRGYANAVARGRPGDPSELPRPRRFEEWTYSNGAQIPWTTRVWTIEGDEPRGPVVIFSHGWGESRHAVLARVEALAPASARIVAWDLPGHGDSSRGRCTLGAGQEWIVLSDLLRRIQGEDLEARRARIEALDATQEDEADWDSALSSEASRHAPHVVLYGFSLGAGVSIVCARELRQRVAAVIAEAPYRLARTPAAAVMRARGLPSTWVLGPAMWMLGASLNYGPRWRGFDRAQEAEELKCPLLVVHGANDEICPPDDGRSIGAAAPLGRAEIIPGAGHNNLWTEPVHAERAGETIRGFLRSIAPAP